MRPCSGESAATNLNVAIAMGNSKLEKFREPLEKLAAFPRDLVAEHVRWALEQLSPTAAPMPS